MQVTFKAIIERHILAFLFPLLVAVIFGSLVECSFEVAFKISIHTLFCLGIKFFLKFIHFIRCFVRPLYGCFDCNIGGIIIGFIPIASAVAAIRDAIAATIDGDWLGALLSLVGIIPGGGAVMEAVDMIAEIVGYVCDAAEAAAEYPSSITIQNAAAAPALTYVLLMIYRKIEVVFGLDLGTSQVKKMVQQQADLGLRGLTKDRVENWEAFLSYGDQTQDVDVTSSWSFTTHRAEDALGEPQTIQLGITNESHPMTLVRAVREAFETFTHAYPWPGLMPVDSQGERCWRRWRARPIVGPKP